MGKTHDDSTIRSESEAPYDPRQSKRSDPPNIPMSVGTRELRFRVWTGAQMITPEDVDDLRSPFHLVTHEIEWHEDIEVMEWTGLDDADHDEKGTPLYQHDIVRVFEKRFVVVHGAFTNTEGIEAYGWHLLRPGQSGPHNDCPSLTVGLSRYATVIGNIYENPHLLESSEDAAEG